jgi:hypothetical protein
VNLLLFLLPGTIADITVFNKIAGHWHPHDRYHDDQAWVIDDGV